MTNFARLFGHILMLILFGWQLTACASAQDRRTAHPDPASQSHARLNNVGYTVMDFALPGSDIPLTAAVWYPTDSQAMPHNYGGPTNGTIAIDAPISQRAGQYPLLVFSHGYGGGGLSAAFFTEELASRGWIVVAPDHLDRHSSVRIRTGRNENLNRMGLFRHAKEIGSSTPADRHKYLYRPSEMKTALNGVLGSRMFGPRIDRNRIALGGHSFGGYTALALSGALPEWHDPRVKALLLFSTGAGGYLFTDQERSRVRIPTFLWMGEKEAEDTRGSQSMVALSQRMFGNFPKPKYFAVLKGGKHTSFNNGFSGRRSGSRLSGSNREFAVINRYSIAFLDRYVNGQRAADSVLLRRGAGLSAYQYDTPAQSQLTNGLPPPITEPQQTQRERWRERRQKQKEERRNRWRNR